MSVRLVGLTGGIATGKSTVSSMLRAAGAVIVDADEIAREVVAPGSLGLARVVEVFGVDVLHGDGSLNREALGARVFADAAARASLESILHPMIAQRSAEALQEAVTAGAALVVYDAALLFETGRAQLFPEVVVVSCPVEVQVERLCTRDGLTEEQAHSRIASQAPVEEKEALATHVLRNDGSLDALRHQVEQLLMGWGLGAGREMGS